MVCVLMCLGCGWSDGETDRENIINMYMYREKCDPYACNPCRSMKPPQLRTRFINPIQLVLLATQFAAMRPVSPRPRSAHEAAP